MSGIIGLICGIVIGEGLTLFALALCTGAHSSTDEYEQGYRDGVASVALNFADECQKHYERGREDGIEEFLKEMSGYQAYDYYGNQIDIVEMAEQLKEIGNE